MNAAVVAHARSRLDDLISAEMRPGGLEAAMRSIARHVGVSFSALWSLRYRPPKDVDGSVLLALELAHARMCDRQFERYRAAREATPAAGPVSAGLGRLAAAIARAADGEG